MIHVTISGNLGADAEVKSTAGGRAVCNFRVAAKDHKGETTWFRCAVWGARGEKIARYLKKGDSVTVVGSLRFGDYQGKPQYEVDASDVALGGGDRRERRNDEPTYEPPARGATDDLPF